MTTPCPYCEAPVTADIPFGHVAVLTACTQCFNAYQIVDTEHGPKPLQLAGAQDLRTTAPPGSIGGELLARLMQTLDAMPVLPEISQRVLRMTSDPDVSMRDLAALVREDAVIAGQVMRAANSALYGGLTQITELDSACARLGMRTIANIVQTVANANLFVTGDPGVEAMMKQLWRHSVVTAVCANELARLVAEPRPDAHYLAGLIHDIGRVALLEIVSNTYGGVVRQLRESPELLIDVLEKFHTLVGLHAVLRWQLPPEFAVAVYYHAHPSRAPHKAWLHAAHLVALSDAVSRVLGYGSSAGTDDQSLLSHPSSSFLGLSDIKLAGLRVDLDEKLEELLVALEA